MHRVILLFHAHSIQTVDSQGYPLTSSTGDEPVIYTGAFLILTAWPGRRSICNKTIRCNLRFSGGLLCQWWLFFNCGGKNTKIQIDILCLDFSLFFSRFPFSLLSCWSTWKSITDITWLSSLLLKEHNSSNIFASIFRFSYTANVYLFVPPRPNDQKRKRYPITKIVIYPFDLVNRVFANGLGDGVQFQLESYQRLKKWYLMPHCLTISIIRDQG